MSYIVVVFETTFFPPRLPATPDGRQSRGENSYRYGTTKTSRRAAKSTNDIDERLANHTCKWLSSRGQSKDPHIESAAPQTKQTTNVSSSPGHWLSEWWTRSWMTPPGPMSRSTTRWWETQTRTTASPALTTWWTGGGREDTHWVPVAENLMVYKDISSRQRGPAETHWLRLLKEKI